MEVNKVQKILVYTDFTDIGNKSIEWAVFLAKKFNKSLYIVHVINENTYLFFDKNAVKDNVNKTLHDISLEIKSLHNVNCEYYAEAGCTCTIINSSAEKIDAFFVVAGTHGKNDPQFLSGSSILKIILKSRIPYFIVQKNSETPQDDRDIIFPVEFQKETKEKTGWISFFAKYLPAKAKILYFKSDKEDLKNNIAFCVNFFNKLDIRHQKYELPKNFAENINRRALRYTYENKDLMICIITTKNPNLFNKLFGYPEKKIISNSYGVPVLCINPKKDLYIPCL